MTDEAESGDTPEKVNHTPGRYVRSAREAEAILANDKRIVVAIRHGGTMGRIRGLVAVELCRRGYKAGWDSICALVLDSRQPSVGAVDVEGRARAWADEYLETGAGIPEDDRDRLSAEWDDMARTLGDDDPEPQGKGERLALTLTYWGMLNRAMRNKLERGECVDLSGCRLTPEGFYIVPEAVWQEDVDYCNAVTEQWIWSVGRVLRGLKQGEIYASHGTELYQNPDYECLFLR